jgi:hypothetical protein
VGPGPAEVWRTDHVATSEATQRCGRTGQHHRKTPTSLRSYDMPPAGPVLVTRADGTTELQPAAPTRRTSFTPARRRGTSGRQDRSKDTVPIERIRATGTDLAPTPQMRRDQEAGHPGKGKRVVVPTAGPSPTPRRLRVDNGHGATGATGLTMGKWIRADKARTAALAAGKLGDPLQRPCIGCRARIGEQCRDSNGRPRDKAHARR